MPWSRSHVDRVLRWMRAHPTLWRHLDTSSHFSPEGHAFAERMKAEGLFSPKTYTKDIRWERYVDAARRKGASMKFRCEKCGEIDHVLIDGYGVGDRLLEGVMFEVTVSDDGVVDAVIEDNAYTRGLNKKKWNRAVTDDTQRVFDQGETAHLEGAVICPQCRGYDVEFGPRP